MSNNDWNNHLRKVYENSDLPLKECMKIASDTYRKNTARKNGKGVNISRRQSKNNHPVGKGVFQDVINVTNKLIGSKARKLTNSEYHLPDSNYSGPGTNLQYKIDNY